MMTLPRVLGLDDFGLTISGLRRAGTRQVRFHVQLVGRKTSRLLRLRPTQRDAELRAALTTQLTRLQHRYPEAALTSRGKRKASWTIDGVLPARRIHELAMSREVQYLSIDSVVGLKKRHSRPKPAWFCVWAIVAIQIEGQVKGNVTVEDRLVLVKARDHQDAERRLRPEWEAYGKPYLNPYGYLVRWRMIAVRDVYALYGDDIQPSGTEVYSRLRTERMKPKYRWRSVGKGV